MLIYKTQSDCCSPQMVFMRCKFLTVRYLCIITCKNGHTVCMIGGFVN